jgi:hypothetical protein
LRFIDWSSFPALWNVASMGASLSKTISVFAEARTKRSDE